MAIGITGANNGYSRKVADERFIQTAGGTVTGNLTVTGTLSTTLLEALSANITVIDIKQYELSGFNVQGNATVQGSVSATGNIIAARLGAGIIPTQLIHAYSPSDANTGVRAQVGGGWIDIKGNQGSGHPGIATSSGLLDLSNVIVGGHGGGGTALRVKQNGTAGSTQNVQSWLNTSNTTLMVVNSAGNVGIGTTSPSNKLSIVDGSTSNINIGSITGKGNGIELFGDNSNTYGKHFIGQNQYGDFFVKYNSTNVIIANSSNSIRLNGNTSYVEAGNSKVELKSPYEKITMDSYGVGAIQFFSGGSGNIERMRIVGASGNIGIGITNPTAKLDILDTTLAGSGSLSGSALNIAQTWNTTGTPTAIKLNVTDTGGTSNAASLLMDLRVGGVSQFRVDKTGTFTGTYRIHPTGPTLFSGQAGVWSFTYFGTPRFRVDAQRGFVCTPGSGFSWSGTSNNASGASDLLLLRDDANTLAQRNGGAAQTFRVYNTFTSRTVSDTTLETLEIKGVAANNFIIQSMRGTTGGVARDIEFRHGAVDTNGTVTNGTLIASIAASGLSVNGHFSATTKSFLIDNPVKGGKLQYGVVESNEHGVYIRGTTSESTIVLPDYWDWLVHEDSVTVTVTPVGKFQPLYVVSQDNKKVVVGGVEDKYNYTIYGTRKDVPELKVELEK